MASKAGGLAPHSPSIDLLRRALYLPFGLAAVYLTFFLALLTPAFQRHFIFLHTIQFPFSPTYDQPERYGLAPAKTRPLTLRTADGENIGAWHILPEVFYQSVLSSTDLQENRFDDEVYEQAMREYPTILYLHGNSMNRAAPFRITAYSALTSRIDANVLAIDYRGFGDSSGTPSEAGLVEDAQTAYRWIRDQQGKGCKSVTVFGQSLGTGIAALLAAKLKDEGAPLEGVVLMAPYTDLKSLVKDFKIGGILPVLKPINTIPFNSYIMDRYMQTHLDTIGTLPQLTSSASPRKTSIVLLHARDDPVIPVTHSRRLFATLLSHSSTAEVQTRTFRSYADVKRFNPHKGKDGGKEGSGGVTFVETEFGGHNQLTEGALDLVRLALDLPSHLAA